MKYSFSKSQIDCDLLIAEIEANTTINQVVYCVSWNSPNFLEIEFASPLDSAGSVALNTVVSNHSVNVTLTTIKKAIENAKTFGRNLIDEYSVTRVLRGTTDQQTLDVLEHLHILQSALSTGSLKAARLILMNMTATQLIPQSDIDTFLHKINKYLGMV